MQNTYDYDQLPDDQKLVLVNKRLFENEATHFNQWLIAMEIESLKGLARTPGQMQGVIDQIQAHEIEMTKIEARCKTLRNIKDSIENPPPQDETGDEE